MPGLLHIDSEILKALLERILVYSSWHFIASANLRTIYFDGSFFSKPVFFWILETFHISAYGIKQSYVCFGPLIPRFLNLDNTLSGLRVFPNSHSSTFPTRTLQRMILIRSVFSPFNRLLCQSEFICTKQSFKKGLIKSRLPPNSQHSFSFLSTERRKQSLLNQQEIHFLFFKSRLRRNTMQNGDPSSLLSAT